MKEREIRLEIEDAKDDEKLVIPVPEPLYELLSKIPRVIHNPHVFLYKNIPIIRSIFKGSTRSHQMKKNRQVKNW